MHNTDLRPWRRRLRSLALVLLVAWVGGCGDDAGSEPDAAGPDAAADSGADARADASVDATATVVIIHTADEHGWLEPQQATPQSDIWGGAANVYSWWVEREGFDPTRDLLLSGGDGWTGAAISTWFQGEPMVDAFNQMGYRAAALGNHEFDFGRDGLARRVAQATYPYLAANVTYSATGGPLEAVSPWIVVEAGGVQVGILGLASVSTPTSGNPRFVSDLSFGDYADAIDEHLPELRDAGAEVVVLLAHACSAELSHLLDTAAPLVDVVFAGHCHQFFTTSQGGVPIISSGYNLAAYSVTRITWDRQAQAVTGTDTKLVPVFYGASELNPVTPDGTLEALVSLWQAEVEAQLGQEIGYTASGITQASWLQGNWVTDSWLWAFPQADVALTNFGGLRQSVTPGSITTADLVGMMPFENILYLLELTGAELLANLQFAVDTFAPNGSGYPAVGGMTFTTVGGVVQVTLAGGAPLDPAATYRVLTIDYLYNGGNGYLFAGQDPAPYDTGTLYRQPVIDWTESVASSAASPLETFLDPNPRN